MKGCVMGLRVFLATALMLLTSLAFAEHAISLDAEAPPKPQTNSAPSAAPVESQTTDRNPATAKRAPGAAPVNVAFPSELDLYLIDTGSREVCDTFDFGGGDIRTECRTRPLPVRAKDSALRGICITRYGNRTCY